MKSSLFLATTAILFAGAANAHESYTSHGIPLIKMDNGEVVEIAAGPALGDKFVTQIRVGSHTYNVFSLAGKPKSGPIFAVQVSPLS